jgi:hypothetical protein
MQIDLDPEGRKVVIFGDVLGGRQALRRGHVGDPWPASGGCRTDQHRAVCDAARVN